MFLNKLQSSNQKLIEYAKELHDLGSIQPDTYIIDVDTFMYNAKKLLDKAESEGIELLFMLKQVGRNPYLAKKLMELGYSGAVVVDYKEAKVMMDHGIPLGNVGHLVQIPTHSLRSIIMTKPQEITVYSLEKIKEIQTIAEELDIHVSITLKVYQEGDQIYKSQEGGFSIHELENIVELTKQMSHIAIGGVTAFPCFLYHEDTKEIQPTANAYTIIHAKDILQSLGCHIRHINLPSATCIASIPLIKALGGTQGEPGHALSGTTPFHVDHDGFENIAYVYVSEVSHQVGDKSYIYAGGYYRRGHMQSCLINDQVYHAYQMEDSAIDYHFEVERGNTRVGDCALFCFRTQIFVTRSDVVLVEGLSKNCPQIVGRYDSLGRKL